MMAKMKNVALLLILVSILGCISCSKNEDDDYIRCSNCNKILTTDYDICKKCNPGTYATVDISEYRDELLKKYEELIK